MKLIPGGLYEIGSNKKNGFEYDFEGPKVTVKIDSFYIDETQVTNEKFKKFVDATGYITEAERMGWSYVFRYFLPDNIEDKIEVHKAPWWIAVENANWRAPLGEGSSINDIMDHPVVHVTRNDAVAYCKWAGKRLPTEAEWEIAAKGGTNNEEYFWGDDLKSEMNKYCNTWQGEFPSLNTKEDGYDGTAPVKTYLPNGYGLYEIIGNVWEWCVNPGKLELKTFDKVSGKDFWREHQVVDDELYAIKGGSFLCHASYCNRYRLCARNSNTAMSSSQNMGFRCVKDI